MLPGLGSPQMIGDARLRAILRNDLLAMVTDSRGCLTYVNPRLLELGGFQWADLSGRPWYDTWVPEGSRDRARRLFEEGLQDENIPAYVEALFLATDGSIRTIAWASSTTLDESGELTAITSVGIDVTHWVDERDRLAAKLDYDAGHDQLTGLANQESFRAELATAVAEASAAGGGHVAVLVLNVDRFHSVTEAVGHDVSDLLLREVAERISRADIRIAARFSGDEFAILLPPGRALSDAIEVTQSLIEAMREPCTIFATEFQIGASIGIALSPEDGTDATNLLRGASMAMRHAKGQGGDAFSLYRASLSRDAKDRMVIEHQLRGALKRGELSLHYQPQVDATSHRIVGLEALARWDHPILGSVPPTRFIPIAEQTGMITSIGLWVLRAACEQSREWRLAGIRMVPIAVNLSARQLASPTLVTDIRAILEATQTPPELLELEVTESAVMADMDAAAGVLRQLGAMGVDISLDDFGTGYSCISYLNYLSVKSIKIDRSFLQASPVVEDANALVRALILLARSLHLRVVAEGVETDEQLQRLKNDDEKCDVYQGYLFSRPLPATETRRLLEHVGSLPAA